MDGGILGSLTHPKGLGSIFYERQRNSQRRQGNAPQGSERGMGCFVGKMSPFQSRILKLERGLRVSWQGSGTDNDFGFKCHLCDG